MGNNFRVDTRALRDIGGKVRQKTADLKTEINKIFSSVEELKTGWTGEDNKAFVNNIEGYKNSMEELTKIVDNYGSFCEQSATYIDKKKAMITEAASSIGKGDIE